MCYMNSPTCLYVIILTSASKEGKAGTYSSLTGIKLSFLGLDQLLQRKHMSQVTLKSCLGKQNVVLSSSANEFFSSRRVMIEKVACNFLPSPEGGACAAGTYILKMAHKT